MITLNEIISIQGLFDSKHKSNFVWNEKITDKNIEILEHLLIAILGELGEAANIVKKISRGDMLLSEVREKISEEIIDILIYVIKLTYQMDIDVEKALNNKIKKNEKRLKKYEL